MGRTKNAKPKRSAHVTVTDATSVQASSDTPSLPETSAQESCLLRDGSLETTVPAEEKRKRVVAFAEVLEEVIPVRYVEEEFTLEEDKPAEPPEVSIHAEAQPSSETHEGKELQHQWTIEILCQQVGPYDESQQQQQEDFPFLLKQYRLCNTKLETTLPEKDEQVYLIRTKDGAEALLDHCEAQCSGDEEIDWNPVGLAVADKTMVLSCASISNHEKQAVQVKLWLSRYAFEVSNPSFLPVTTRRRQWSKRQQPCRHLQLALGSVFPESVLADAAKQQPSSGEASITAKMVYDVTDNVQLLKGEKEHKDAKPLGISGLVPKLRPYQEEAVRWMLQRERGPSFQFTARGAPRFLNADDANNFDTDEGREWEMAWVVLTTDHEKDRHEQRANNSKHDENMQRCNNAVVPLYQWRNRVEYADSVSTFYCPFLGWFATSYLEARRYTIQAVLPHWNPTVDPYPFISGGILADSMGLGKTVEVLACILANQYEAKKHVVRKLDFSNISDQEEKKQDDKKETCNSVSRNGDKSSHGSVAEPNTPEFRDLIAKRPRFDQAYAAKHEDSILYDQNDNSETGEGNFDSCHICEKRKGRLMYCSECPRSFHRNCIEIGRLISKRWVCHICKAEHSANKVVDGELSLDTIIEMHCDFSKTEHFDKNMKVLSMIHEMVTTLMDHEFGASFRHPIDDKEAPGYREAVRNPMDLGTIASKLIGGEYEKRFEDIDDVTVAVLKDVELVWYNCFIFNGCSSPLYKASRVLRRKSHAIQKHSFDHLLTKEVRDRISAMKIEFENSLERDIDRSLVSPLCENQKKPKLEVTENINSLLGECLCGHSGHSKKSLSMVVCRKCSGPMHGVCAGFESEEQLVQETEVSTKMNRDTGDELVCRICEDDRCPCCVAQNCGVFSDGEQRLIPSRATVIVTPPSIINQWAREIRRHTAIPSRENASSGYSVSTGVPSLVRNSGEKSPLKVVVYPGVRELCHNSGRRPSTAVSRDRPRVQLIHPRILADADIVLMTFQALMGDLAHSADNPYVADSGKRSGPSRSNLRKRKRFRVVPSPLTSIKWWRVCLDEAQRVETPTAASAQMALKLQARHRWCVSGTPVSKGRLEDLYGLLLFLGLVPFSSKGFFAKSLQSTHRGVMERVKHLLQTVFWRTTKACPRVKNEMGVPDQVEMKVILRFSSIEKHFYDRQLEETILLANNVAGMGESHRRASQTELLAVHLHRLRAACCHPQVGSSGIGKQKRKRKNDSVSGGDDRYGSVSISSGVLSMDQILDRLIDDAKTKCEEAQRLSVMHTNALACLSKLKVEAKHFGCSISESDEELLTQSCESYLESLDLTDSNAKPSTVVGEAVLSGCSGFRSARKVVRDGRAILDWKLRAHNSMVETTDNFRQVWARIDFEGPSKKILEVRIRPIHFVPRTLAEEASGIGWYLLKPRDCVLQVSNSSVGGMFVDVMAFTISDTSTTDAESWETFGGFRTNKSKSWRLVVKNFHQPQSGKPSSPAPRAYFVGVEVQLMEADIAMDTLQRLHVLHNLSLSLSSLQQEQAINKRDVSKGKGTPLRSTEHSTSDTMSSADIKTKLKWMGVETEKIESLYMDAARTIHCESQRQLRVALAAREQVEHDLFVITQRVRKSRSQETLRRGFWEDCWWDDLLSTFHLHASQSERFSLCDKVATDLNDFYADTVAGRACKKRFPPFHNEGGLKVALSMYMEDVVTESGCRSHALCVKSVTELKSNPSETEVLENRHCGECRKDWNQKGPKCRHCKLEESLEELENDPALLCVLNSLGRFTREVKTSGPLRSAKVAAKIDERAKKFFEVVKAAGKERLAARLAWRTHFDLLSDIDELNQCKQTMRLAHEGEDLTNLSEEEQNFIVSPFDINTRRMDHAAKQAMALANLRRTKDTLRYLKNQNAERRSELKKGEHRSTPDGDGATSCVVCLQALEGERAVLRCGHSFHYSPCLENLMKRSGSHYTISCPLRCSLRTKREDVMIATDKRKDDGSRCRREVKGSWGTKVTRLVSDVMDVSDLGEKSIVFSQWDDMLEVVEQALTQNGVNYVRARSLTHIGDSLKQLRSPDCTVLLLNVKNGAEGLTLVEATHVFMVEPLLNCGLDSQAINRIHRIGQSCKTYVHRYLIEDTIEVKIDKMRTDRQEDQLEDAIHDAKMKHDVRGGGIDGGFSQSELEELLQ